MENEKQVVSVNRVSESFNGQTKEKSAELASIAVATAAKVEIESAYIMALKKPRNEEEARIKILHRCMSLRFAEKAIYKKPVGGGFIEGPSIRFTEEALRLWTNVKTQQTTIYEDEIKRVIKVIVIDLETNSSYSNEVVIEKHVERKKSEGRIVLSQRKNTFGQSVYVVVATEDELMNKTQALASKCIRNNGLRLIPEDIKEEAEEVCRKIVREKINADPAAAKRQISDSFATIGVLPTNLEEYLKCSIDTIGPKQIEDLRNIYTAIKDGQTTWREVMEEASGKKIDKNGVKMPQAKAFTTPKSETKKTKNEELKSNVKNGTIEEEFFPEIDDREPGVEG